MTNEEQKLQRAVAEGIITSDQANKLRELRRAMPLFSAGWPDISVRNRPCSAGCSW